MARGISLHIGLNEVDPDAYGDKLELGGCVNDANDLSEIADKQGYETNILLNEQATAANIIQKISENARNLQNGDIFFLTYSGHGSSIPDSTGDETDGQDESWVLYDRQFLDDELYNLWLDFKEGVRILVLSDSCNSGTMLKMVVLNAKLKRSKSTLNTIMKNFDKEVLKVVDKEAGAEHKVKVMPAALSYKNFNDNRDRYREIQHMHKGVKSQEPAASLILISGCQDDEFSYDYGTNGLFTSKVKETWNRGSFGGTHIRFHTDIAQKVNADQSDQNPNFMTLGSNVSAFTQNKPFIINAPGWPIAAGSGTSSGTGENTGTGMGTPAQEPFVILPTSWNINDGIPEFQINKGGNNYYYVEVVNNEQLFDYSYWEDYGTDQNSYFTWNDSAVSNRLTIEQFSIPSSAWNKIKDSDGLYVRIGTTSSSDESVWDNHMVSPNLMSGSHAPFMHLIGAISGNTGGTTDGSGTVGGNGGGSGAQLSASVGYGGENDYNDVLLVQNWLNDVPISEGGPTTALDEDGEYGSKTRNAITAFQRKQGLITSGKIDPSDSTFIILSIKCGYVTLVNALITVD